MPGPDWGQVLGGSGAVAGMAIIVNGFINMIGSRRKRRAADELDEGSVGPTLVERSFAASDAQIVFLEKANSAERASYERRIKALEADVKRLTQERDGLYRTVEDMRRQAQAMQEQLDAMKARLESLIPPKN